MKAVLLDAFGGPEKVHFGEIPKPVPLDNEVLIRVAYAGVNPVDWKIREGYLKNVLPHEFPIIPGWDVAGTVVEVGANVTNLVQGDQVYSYIRKPLVKWGSYAEYVTFEAKDVIKKPTNISLAQAAALPLVSLTAWQALFDSISLKEGETILIQGGSGGVGSMALQFAKAIGAKVLTTSSAQKLEYVRRLGASIAIDYKNENVVARVKEYAPEGIDVAFDCVGGEAFQQGISCLKREGRIVSILERLDPEEEKRLHIIARYVFVSPSGPNLQSIKDLIEQKKVIPPHIEEMDLQDAAEAQEKLKAGHVLGKIVLKVR